MRFSEELKKWQIVLSCSQKELGELLYNVPTRTIQSWILGEKEPPVYVQELICFKLKSIENDISFG